MESKNSQSASVGASQNTKACCSEECSQDTEAHNKWKDCLDENFTMCAGSLRKHIHANPVVALGVAAAAGFLLGCLLKGKNN